MLGLTALSVTGTSSPSNVTKITKRTTQPSRNSARSAASITNVKRARESWIKCSYEQVQNTNALNSGVAFAKGPLGWSTTNVTSSPSNSTCSRKTEKKKNHSATSSSTWKRNKKRESTNPTSALRKKYARSAPIARWKFPVSVAARINKSSLEGAKYVWKGSACGC